MRTKVGCEIHDEEFQNPRLAQCHTVWELGKLFQTIRLSIGMSERDAARASGMSAGHVRALEEWASGHAPMTGDVVAYMRLLGFHPEDILLMLARFDLWPNTRLTAQRSGLL